MTVTEKAELLALLEKRAKLRAENWLSRYKPYAKQVEFHTAGAKYRERLFRASNQSGKTLAGAAEVAMHLTGKYPDWWQGKRFVQASRWIAGSETAELTKKGLQRLLFGNPDAENEWGQGAIPKADIVNITRRVGPVSGCIGSATIRHVSGGSSTIALQSYDQGRSRWQADTVDGVWLDEEPPLDIYTEALTRTNASGGPVFLTFTPLLGMSQVVGRFLTESNPDRVDICMTLDDVEHYSPAERARIIASYPEHERDARARGIPMVGSGLVFPVIESAISVQGFEIPPHWARIVGLDFGIDHPSAMVWLAHDRDTDNLYAYDVWRERDKALSDLAAIYRPRGSWIPAAWPHDGLQRDKGSGLQLAAQLKMHGVATLPNRATFADGTFGVEAGLSEMLDRFRTGRLRIFSHLTPIFEELRLYHRKDGQVVKLRDDAISALRYALMMRRHAKTYAEWQAENTLGVKPGMINLGAMPNPFARAQASDMGY